MWRHSLGPNPTIPQCQTYVHCQGDNHHDSAVKELHSDQEERGTSMGGHWASVPVVEALGVFGCESST